MKRLAYLNISNETWNQESAAFLATMSTIQTLDVDGCNVSDQDLRLIAKMSGLKWLHVARTNVTDQGLQAVADKLKLSFLSAGPDVTRVGAAAIHKHKPDCWFEVVDQEGFVIAAGDGSGSGELYSQLRQKP